MRRTIVRYKLRADRVAEHEAMIRAVFAELAEVRPPGFRYGAFKAADGVSFVHVAFAESGNPLDLIAAFKTFTANIKDRCEEPPQSVQVEEVGAYGM